jgi:hypothetical protein
MEAYRKVVPIPELPNGHYWPKPAPRGIVAERPQLVKADIRLFKLRAATET